MAFKSGSNTTLINNSRQITSGMVGDPVFGKHQNNASGVPTKYFDRLFSPANTTTGVNIGDKWIYAGSIYGSSTAVNISTCDFRSSNPLQRTYHRKIYLTRLTYVAANNSDYLTFRLKFLSSGTAATNYVYAAEYIHYTSLGTSKSGGSSVIYPLGTSTSASVLGSGITSGFDIRYRNPAEINIMGQSQRNDRGGDGERNKYTTVDWHIGYEDFRNNNVSNTNRIYRNIARGYGHNTTIVGEISQLEIATVFGSTVTAQGYAYDYSRSST
tara:strand:+ start:4844 stop:5653 length:810 start_codon:yes stop_codon:yes gene_type:complete